MTFGFLNPLHWKKSMLIAVLLTFVGVWFSFIDTYSLSTRWELSERKKELKIRTEKLNADTEALKIKILSLQENEALLEKIAREEYGMRKPGETVYKIRRTN